MRILTNLAFALVAAVTLMVAAGPLLGRPVLFAAVLTNSMRPTINEGDVILIAPYVGARQLRPGELAVFRSISVHQWVVHRIVGGDARAGYTTRGDANALPDADPVMPADIAGTVPTWNGHVLRIPRLGRLASATGGASRPLFALGLLSMAGLLMLRSGRAAAHRPRFPVLEAYAGLLAVVLVMGFLPAWALSRHVPFSYEVVAAAPPTGLPRGQVVAGTPSQQTVIMRNPLPVPVVILVHSPDPHLVADPGYAVVPARGSGTLRYVLSATEPGKHESTLQQVVTLPLLPPAWLAAAMPLGRWAPAALTALLPTAAVLAVCSGDRRLRSDLRRWWGRVAQNRG